LKAGFLVRDIQPHLSVKFFFNIGLCFADFEHLGAAFWACTLGSRFTILHFNGFRIAHFSLRSALNAIRLHDSSFFENG
jgi:hypothetical protein